MQLVGYWLLLSHLIYVYLFTYFRLFVHLRFFAYLYFLFIYEYAQVRFPYLPVFHTHLY